ncbi:dihydroxyacetone kinase subunit L [Psychromarinibacter sp. S121]|uniref:dihydroxyacetone kinase subunit L n=1 Tax=Psychromarinibacter sp. S121 TaxID=3415127 RepID=UPI003C7E03F5
MAGFTTDDLRAAATRIAAHVQGVADELNAADGQLGDGDLGITVSKGWAEIASAADALPDDVGMAFLDCAKAFQKVSSSSYGTLTATAFMAAAKACKGRTEVPFAEIPALVAAARDAMMTRGKAELGDKTVLDALNAVAQATEGKEDPATLLAAARDAITQALDTFRPQENRVGRARMFGERSKGLDDPGMLALARVAEGL